MEESKKKGEEINDKYPHYKDVNEDALTVSLEQYDQIKVGISVDKVIEVAGYPIFSETTKLFSIFGYLGHGGEGSMTITFDNYLYKVSLFFVLGICFFRLMAAWCYSFKYSKGYYNEIFTSISL
ncbi:hypothetical protein BcerKBAB4_5453 (plasmid) [Bacillus mycoides KBAB4]|uniref:Uncharacterized protein n=1 Tax=Bacillus mycoides (strain KBAB4) TaxID=315730 RepID=A9VV13_BACMK|nr:hypothetical protein BcerKBAB4_5453 [Bacillus mycoides KBAB4]